jgi:hydroxyacid-oxoacid transhydrogenase
MTGRGDSMALETAFTMDTSSIKYGVGVTRELGWDMRRLGGTRVMVVTDPYLNGSEPVEVALASLRECGVDAVLYDRARVEPTDVSLREAAAFAADGGFDGYVAVGGGSVMDTAKAANLYATWPADFMTYVNPPIGMGEPVPGALRPLIAVPTTAGTGSECSGIVVFDLEKMRAKTAIRQRACRPSLAVVDALNTRTMPPMAIACSGLDVFCHALESLTALPYTERPAPEDPDRRPAYQGSNPISDVWAARAAQLGAANIVRAFEDPADDEARGAMLLAATFAGIGFANAGTHLAHAMSYPVSGMVRDYRAEGYPVPYPLVPHGMSVALNAPAVFRFTAPAAPERHLRAAELVGAEAEGPDGAGEAIARRLTGLLRRLGMPNGLSAVSYGPDDLDDLVAGTLPQHTVTKLSPRPATAEDLRRMFQESMSLW